MSEMPRILVNSWTSVEPAELRERERDRGSFTTRSRRCRGTDDELYSSPVLLLPTDVIVMSTGTCRGRNELWLQFRPRQDCDSSAMNWLFRFTPTLPIAFSNLCSAVMHHTAVVFQQQIFVTSTYPPCFSLLGLLRAARARSSFITTSVLFICAYCQDQPEHTR